MVWCLLKNMIVSQFGENNTLITILAESVYVSLDHFLVDICEFLTHHIDGCLVDGLIQERLNIFIENL